MIEQFIFSMFSIFVLIFFLCTTGPQQEVKREYYLYRSAKLKPIHEDDEDE